MVQAQLPRHYLVLTGFMSLWNVRVCAQSCPALCDPMDCKLPGASVHGIFQVRILEWSAISFFRGSSQPCDQTWVSYISRYILYHWATREVQYEFGEDTDIQFIRHRDDQKSFVHLLDIAHLFPTPGAGWFLRVDSVSCYNWVPILNCPGPKAWC